MKLECLEVLNDLLRRFASSLSEAESRDCLGALFGELKSSRAAARKRAINCIASLSASLPEKMLEAQLTTPIFEQMEASGVKIELRRTYIQTLSAISRSGTHARPACPSSALCPACPPRAPPHLHRVVRQLAHRRWRHVAPA